MARRHKEGRPDPLNEGVLGTIYKTFLAPLTQYKPVNLTLKDWMEELFHLKTRAIDQYIVRRPFQMPGLFVEAPYIKIQGIGARNVRVGARIWTRTDITQPNVVDVELMGSSSKRADQWFSLSQSEWNQIRPLLQDIAELTKDERKELGLTWAQVKLANK